jgi:hypothetical protein
MTPRRGKGMGSIPENEAQQLAVRDARANAAAGDSVLREAVLGFTTQIFGEAASLAPVIDPETGVRSIQVTVEATGSVDCLLALNDRWHRELANLGETANSYCLSLVPCDESN